MHCLARSALIVKLAALGDVAMALPMVSALRSEDPTIRITWMCGQTIAPLLRCVEGIAQVVSVRETAMLAGSPASQIGAVLSAWWALGARRFDAIYIAHSDARYRVLTWPMAAPVRRSLSGRRGFRAMVPGRSHSDEYVRLVTARDDCNAAAFPAPRLKIDLPPHISRRLATFNPGRRPLIAITPGGARNVARENPLRRWPVERYAELAHVLAAEGTRVVLTGSRTDGWVRPAFRGMDVLDLVGATDLPSLAAVLKHCDVVVGHDSGPLHVARLVGTAIVALLGPTPPGMFFRGGEAVTYLWPAAALPCAPCYDGRDFAACPNNICMKLIDVREVARRALDCVRDRG